MFRAIAFAMSALFFAQTAIADDREKLIGTWKVLSYENEFKDGSPASRRVRSEPDWFHHPYSRRPNGGDR